MRNITGLRVKGYPNTSTLACTTILRVAVTWCLQNDQQVTHTHAHTPTENNTPDTDTHTYDKNHTANPQTDPPRNGDCRTGANYGHSFFSYIYLSIDMKPN